MKHVEVLVLEAASPSSVAITLELLETANRLRRVAGRPAAFEVRLAGSGAAAARDFFGVLLARDTDPTPDVVVVPGLALATESAVLEGLQRPDMVAARDRLAHAARAGSEVASSCSAVFLAAAAGLLEGRRATTTWWLSPLFRRLYPGVRLDAEAMVVTDGGVTTAAAAMAQMDLMLSVITRHADPQLAERCARYMLLESRASQARYMAISFLVSADERIARAERWARERLDESFPIERLAEAAGLSPRTFARRVSRTTGLSPVRFLQRLRVERAVELLETTRLPLDEIARQVGYAEPSTLRRLLRREGSAGAREIRSAL